VVDDDYSVRQSLQRLIRSAGFAVKVFASAEEFWESEYLYETRCLVLDVRMAGMNGVELWRKLAACHRDIPVVFITAHGNEAQRSQALLDGAIDYLYKPFNDEALLKAIKTALHLEVVKAKGNQVRRR